MQLLKKFNYQPLDRSEGPAGRMYIVGEGRPLPSVTTILSRTKDLTHLIEWRNRVGDEEAAKITSEATSIGNSMHKNLEKYILGEKLTGSFMSQTLAKVIIKNAFPRIEEIWGSEVALYSPGLYAGTTDLVGCMTNKKTAIIDFKNSLREKKKEWIEDYFLQGCAYKLAHDETYGTNIDQIIIMIATRDITYQEFIIEGSEIDFYTNKWLKRLEQYYNLNSKF